MLNIILMTLHSHLIIRIIFNLTDLNVTRSQDYHQWNRKYLIGNFEKLIQFFLFHMFTIVQLYNSS